MKDIPVNKSSNHACTEQNSLINGPYQQASASLHSVLSLHGGGGGGGGGGEQITLVSRRRLARTHAKAKRYTPTS